MIVDTSALLAIVFGEPERDAMLELIVASRLVATPSTTLVEIALKAANRHEPLLLVQTYQLIEDFRIAVAPFLRAHVDTAAEASVRFGKGRHPAKLNFGDCMVYAVAKLAGAPLLFKGGDFALTDIEPALPATV